MIHNELESDLQVVALLTQKPGDEKKVYHYTTPAGLKGILENKEIYFTDSDYLNDASEKQLARTVFESVLNEASDKLENTFAEGLFRGLRNYADGTCMKKRYYVFSASCDPDSLSMWNYYSKGNAFEGYNIGFDPFALIERLGVQKKACLFGKVIYEQNEMKQKIRAVTLNCNTLWNKYADVRAHERILAFVFESLVCLGIFYKKVCFESEDEYRFVLPMSDDEGNGPEFRLIRGCLIPYAAIKFSGTCPALMDSIHISPLLNSELYQSGLERLLKKLGYAQGAITVKASDIPVRY